jgi:hypothetical protein
MFLPANDFTMKCTSRLIEVDLPIRWLSALESAIGTPDSRLRSYAIRLLADWGASEMAAGSIWQSLGVANWHGWAAGLSRTAAFRS